MTLTFKQAQQKLQIYIFRRYIFRKKSLWKANDVSLQLLTQCLEFIKSRKSSITQMQEPLKQFFFLRFIHYRIIPEPWKSQ